MSVHHVFEGSPRTPGGLSVSATTAWQAGLAQKPITVSDRLGLSIRLSEAEARELSRLLLEAVAFLEEYR